jgi:Ca2+/Na+ antiporter
VESSERESTLTIFLGLVPLSDEETTARRRIIRVVVYMDGAILLLLGFLFYKQSWTVVSGWILVNLALLVWYFIMIRRAARKR